MTLPSSGVLGLTQATLNSTVSQIGTAVIDPSYNLTGTPQSNAGSNAYPLAYGAGSETLATPGTLPVTFQYMSVGATAPASGSNTVSGLATIQGNAKNPTGRPDTQVPAVFALAYQQLLTFANLVYRI